MAKTEFYIKQHARVIRKDLQSVKLHNSVCIHTETRLRRGSQNFLCAVLQRMGLHLAVPQKSDVGESRRTEALHHVAGEYQQTRESETQGSPFPVFVDRTWGVESLGGSTERRVCVK